ncbi:MAG TPA: Fic family protein [Noviherbaspirillum sp.]|nr:Fic family protein [Noviherbaspirillum sp.]
MIPGDKAYYPGTDILINKFDIRDAAKLRSVEYKFAAAREIELRMRPIEGKFDFDHLKAIHKRLLGDVYEWAGKIREIDFAKPNRETGMKSKFMPAVVIDLKAEEFNKFVADRNQLKGLTKAEFVKAITEVHTKLNELHPFREGNGRSTRVFLTQLAKEAGFELDLSKIDRDRWNLASHRAMTQYDMHDESKRLVANQSDMRQIFHEAITPTLAHAFTVEKRADAVRFHPALDQAFARLDAIERFAKGLPGGDASRLVDAERTRITAKLQEGKIPPLNPYLQGRFGMAQERALSPAIKNIAALNSPAMTQATETRSRGMRM